jgi:hypothetical protein
MEINFSLRMILSLSHTSVFQTFLAVIGSTSKPCSNLVGKVTILAKVSCVIEVYLIMWLV